jgi:hypothetical protein
MRLSTAALTVLTLTLVLAACGDPEVEPYDEEDDGETVVAGPTLFPDAIGTPVEAFLNACRETLADTPAESDDALETCECAVAAARDRLEGAEYDAFLASFRPDRDEVMETIMTNEEFDLERFDEDLAAIQEQCGFTRPAIN